MLLAGDIGGTKSRLAVFAEGGSPREPLAEELLPSASFDGIEPLIREFLKWLRLCPGAGLSGRCRAGHRRPGGGDQPPLDRRCRADPAELRLPSR